MIHSTTTRRGPLCYELWFNPADGERGVEVHRLREGRPDDTHLSVASAWESLGTTWVHFVESRLVPYDYDVRHFESRAEAQRYIDDGKTGAFPGSLTFEPHSIVRVRPLSREKESHQ